MSYLEPINQTKLYGLEKYFTELVNFYKNGNYPNKIEIELPLFLIAQ